MRQMISLLPQVTPCSPSGGNFLETVLCEQASGQPIYLRLYPTRP